jgi:Putative beta-barrel porin-2, OmpL-like. bbp2
MKLTFRIIGAFLFLILISPFTLRAEDAPPAPFEISGFVDTYYSYNFNNPQSRLNDPNTTNFDFDHNTFGLSMAEVALSKAAEPVGFRIDLDFGPTADWVHCLSVNCDPSTAGAGNTESTYKNIQQAYVTWATPAGVTIDMGKFVTHMGLEVIESKDNWNYTRSLLFCCPIPYYHSGVRANYAINDMIFVNGYVYNGWNNVIDNNDMKTFGAQVGITPIPQLPIVLNWIGPEALPGQFENRQGYDAIVTYNATDTISFILNYDYGSLKDLTTVAQDTLKYSGWAAYARWKQDSNALAVRYEMTDDKDNVMFLGSPLTTDLNNNGNKIKEVTVTAEHTIAGNLLTRLEYRMDSSDDKIYEDKHGMITKDSQSRVVASAVYSF